MRRSVVVLMALLVAVAMMVAVQPAAAAGIPGDGNNDNHLTEQELASTILTYLAGGGTLNLAEIRDGAHVYAYWKGEPRSIEDTAGRPVTIYRPVEKIVIVSSDAARAIQILGAEDKVVGITDTIQKFPFYFPAISNQTVVGTWREVDWEKVMQLEPDMLIVLPAGTINANLAADKLKGSTITVAGFYLYVTADYDQVFDEFRKLAILVEKEDAAEEFIDWHNDYLDRVEAFVADEEKPDVFLTYTAGAIGKTSDISSYGPGSIFYQLCVKAGGRPITENETSNPKVSAEWVAAENPDVMIMICGNVFGWWETESTPADLLQQLLAGKSWGTLNATKNNQIYAVPWSVTNGFEHTYGIVLLAKLLHPDLPIEPGDVSQEFLEDFLRVEYPEGEGKVLAYSGSTTLRT